MIGRTVRNVYLEGNVREALTIFCRKHGIVKAAEGLCMAVRVLPEYKSLLEISKTPVKIPDDEKLNDSNAQPAVG